MCLPVKVPHEGHVLATTSSNSRLTGYAWLSIATAIVTISLKMSAWRLTGSVGLLSDGLESFVNLIAAVVVLWALIVAARGPDEVHAYGHTKAEYFSSGLEGGLILLASTGILYTAVPRLWNPQPIHDVGIGIVLVSIAAAINGLAGIVLLRAAREHRSITLESDARHLFTDVWTTAGVVLGVVLVGSTGWTWLDPVLAIAVGLQILHTGITLVKKSINGLLDAAIPVDELAELQSLIDRFQEERSVFIHAVRTRQAGRRRFVSMHVLVPGNWSVDRGHDLVNDLENDIRTALPETTVFTHLEPIEKPESWNDSGLDG